LYFIMIENFMLIYFHIFNYFFRAIKHFLYNFKVLYLLEL
jgi:hypothetical protein